MISLQDRAAGCFLGLAAGDALGTTLEFKPPGSFVPIQDMLGGGPFDLKAGQWTDDCSMALCLADSLLASGWDPTDQMQRYWRWYRNGENSSTGRCFDIGNTVRDALTRFRRTGNAFAGSTDPYSAGNGSLMRLAPIPLCYHADAELAEARAMEMSRCTHGAPACLDACRVGTRLILLLLQGEHKEKALAQLAEIPGLCADIEEVVSGSYQTKDPPEIRGTGYVVQSLEAALWAFAKSDSFESGALLAVNLGDDADTTGAIYGQFAGACYGVSGIPRAWRERVQDAERIASLGVALVEG